MNTLEIVLCADRRVIPGLHVTAFSAVRGFLGGVPGITVFTDTLTDADKTLLRKTLDGAGKPYVLEFRHLDGGIFRGLPSMKGSLAPYFRLHAAAVMDVPRFLYLDTDLLCGLDLSGLSATDLLGYPVAWVPEAPMESCADAEVGESASGEGLDYYNSGVMLIDPAAWRTMRITEHAMEYLRMAKARFWDQSALNHLLCRDSLALDERYNTIINMRRNWHLLTGNGLPERVLHFADHPKPWDLGAELLHPHHALWNSVFKKTALAGNRSWHSSPWRRFPPDKTALSGYRKALKDRILFQAYSRGLFPVKGTFSPANSP